MAQRGRDITWREIATSVAEELQDFAAVQNTETKVGLSSSAGLPVSFSKGGGRDCAALTRLP